MHSNSKNVTNERVKLNTTKAKNEKMRKEVDVLRKELSSAIMQVFNLNKNIKKAKKEAENQNKEYVIGKKISEESNN
jgi:hypothetical protein